MLARYQIVRGKRPPGDPLPDGTRIDVRKHTHHVLSPNAEAVVAFEYRRLLEQRFRERRAEFADVAAAGARADVYIGCNCPTKTNPDVSRCHTVVALHFMKEKYPRLRVVLPE